MVSTHLKNISQIGSFPQVGVKIKHIWNHHLDFHCDFAWNALPNITEPRSTLGTFPWKATPPWKLLKIRFLYRLFPKIGGFCPPKWMVYFMENPIKMDDLGVPLFLETPLQAPRFCKMEPEIHNPIGTHNQDNQSEYLANHFYHFTPRFTWHVGSFFWVSSQLCMQITKLLQTGQHIFDPTEYMTYDHPSIIK